jgi:DNA invertase Pin-like site-specific DNA recombinase
MLVGYARVSTDDQTLDPQRDALRAAGCEQVFEDEGVSGATRRRPGLDEALSALRAGDVPVVWKLDRLGRSLSHLIEIVTALGDRGIDFRSLTEAIDTTNAGGRLILHMMGALAEFERSLISERTRAGMRAARRRGRHVGRPPVLTEAQRLHARELVDNGEPVEQVALLLKVSSSTLRRAVTSNR